MAAVCRCGHIQQSGCREICGNCKLCAAAVSVSVLLGEDAGVTSVQGLLCSACKITRKETEWSLIDAECASAASGSPWSSAAVGFPFPFFCLICSLSVSLNFYVPLQRSLTMLLRRRERKENRNNHNPQYSMLLRFTWEVKSSNCVLQRCEKKRSPVCAVK